MPVTGWWVEVAAPPATFGGSGALTATATLPTLPTSPALSGVGSLTATVVARPSISAALSGAGDLIATVGVTRDTRAPALSGAGTLTAVATPLGAASPTFAGSGTLTAAITARIAAPLSGSGALTATAGVTKDSIPATLSGAGTLTAAARVTAAAALSGAGTLTASATKASDSAAAGLSGTGTLSATAAPRYAVAAALSGSGTLVGYASQPVARSAALSGAGTLSAVVQTFVTRDTSTGNLMLSGQRYRFGGANTISLGLSEANSAYGATVDGDGLHLVSHTEIDATLTAAQALNARVLRSYGSLMTVSKTNAIQPSLGVFNDAAFEPVDYALSQCAALGIKLVFPLVDNYTFYPGGKFWYCTANGVSAAGAAPLFFTNSTVIASFKAHIAHVLDHVNVYTGIAYKNDPTILAWETGNELDSGGVSIATWTNDIAGYIKTTKGAQQLVMDGGSYDGTDAAALTNSNVDILSCHTYDDSKPPKWMNDRATEAHGAGKAWYIGEYPWNDVRINPPFADVTLAWTLTDMLSQINASSVIDGDAAWILHPPLSSFTAYTLHAPGDDANMIARDSQLADHNSVMASGTVTGIAIMDHTSTSVLSNSLSLTFNGTNWTPKAGHVVAYWVTVTAPGAGIVVPSGWENGLAPGTNTVVDNGAMVEYCIYHVVTAAEETAGTLTYTASAIQGTLQTTIVGVVLAGVDPSNVVDSAASTFSSTAVSTHVLPGLTGSNLLDNSLVLSGVAKDGAGGETTPNGWGLAAYGATNQSLYVFQRNARTTAGVNVAATNVTSDTSDEYASITVAFNKAPVAAALSGTGTLSVAAAPAVAAALSGDGTLSATAAVVQPDVPRPLRIPNRYVGPMALRNQFRRATPTTGPPAQFLIDTFTGTDAATLDSHTADSGATWSKHATWTGAGTIQTNRIWFGATESHYAASATPSSADYSVTASIYVASLATNSFTGVMGRMQAGVDTGYMAFPFYDGATVTIYIKRILAGTGTNLSSAAVTTPTVASTHTLELRMVGSSLSALWDGATVVGPVTDTNITLAGSAGVMGQTGTSTTGFHVDNITAART